MGDPALTGMASSNARGSRPSAPRRPPSSLSPCAIDAPEPLAPTTQPGHATQPSPNATKRSQQTWSRRKLQAESVAGAATPTAACRRPGAHRLRAPGVEEAATEAKAMTGHRGQNDGPSPRGPARLDGHLQRVDDEPGRRPASIAPADEAATEGIPSGAERPWRISPAPPAGTARVSRRVESRVLAG